MNGYKAKCPMPYLDYNRSTMTFVKQSTKFEVNYTKFMWTLHNCSFFTGLQKSKVLTSETFRATKTNQLCHVSFCMITRTMELHMDGYYLPLDLIITLSCVKRDGTPIKSQTFTKRVNSIEKKVIAMKLYNLEDFIDDDALVFLIVIEDLRAANSLEILDDSSSTCQLYRSRHCPNNLDAMYRNQELCDVAIVVEDESLHAHSVVLAALSPYFLTAFSRDRLEGKSRHTVDMSQDRDVTADVVRGFLDFAYGIKSMLELNDIVVKLAIMARRYEIADMQKACEYLISDTLTESTVIKMLLFAVKFDLAVLRKKAVQFAKLHIDVVKQSKQFEEIYVNKELMLELL